MLLTHATSMVFVGGEFPPAMFDERELFGGVLDPDQVKLGPIGRFSYSSGKFGFEIRPDRIDLKSVGSDILPDELVGAARMIVHKIEPTRAAVHVSGIGMNCDTAFKRQMIGERGADFCLNLFSKKMNDLVQFSEIFAFARTRFRKGDIMYSIRIEPHVDSEGEDLFVGVNGHRDVQAEEKVDVIFDEISTFRRYVTSLHRRIMEDEGDSVK